MKHVVINPYFDTRRKPQEETEVGEWQYDSNGKKFRKVGNVIEYAMTINTANAGTVYADDLPKTNKKLKEQAEQRLKKSNEALKKKPDKNCPFKVAKGGANVLCDENCSFYEDEACIITKTASQPKEDTKDKYCPIARVCNENCAMYKNGCMLMCIFKGMKPGKE